MSQLIIHAARIHAAPMLDAHNTFAQPEGGKRVVELPARSVAVLEIK